TILATLVLYTLSCASQEIEAELNLVQFLKTPAYIAPEQEKLDALKIPFWQNNLYGICNYDFEIILAPQFEDIKTPDPMLHFFKAKKNGSWSIYDFEAKKLLPIETLDSYKIEHKIIFIGNSGSKRSDLSLYISEIKDPIPRLFIFSDESSEYLPKYYYFSKNTKTPIKSWFKPDYRNLFNNSEYHNSKFTNSFQYGYIKVMDENQKFTLLDQNGIALFAPVLNCAAISLSKILLLGTNGKCAVMDLNKGLITDYIFTNIEKTSNSEMLFGFDWDKDADNNYFVIDSSGHIKALSKLGDYSPISSEYSLIRNDMPGNGNNYILYNEITGETERNWPNSKLNSSFKEIGFSIEQHNKIIGIETLQGDTILSPPFESFTFINDSIYYFKQDNRQGIANKEDVILYEVSDAALTYHSPGYFKIKLNNKYGIINSNGHEIFPAIYDKLFHHPDVDRVIVRIDNKYGYYEFSSGNELLPIKLNYLAKTFLPYKSGTCIEIKINKDRYIVNSNLEIRYQEASTPILNKSHFKIDSEVKELHEDFEKSKLPKSFPNYVAFNGESMVHLFQCDGKYITSISGLKYVERAFIRTSELALYFKEDITNLGIGQFRGLRGVSLWVRLEDGMVYRKK
ncbi:MAG: hypothetical protein ACI8P3_004067, partial [Saprospiraceae bacterium]